MAWAEHVYPDGAALAASLARLLEAAVYDAREAGRIPTLALAGGRTPLPAYAALAATATGHLRVLPTDDRCVPRDHPASNAGELQRLFAAARGVDVLPLTTDDGEPDASERHARRMLASLPDAFDAVVLGMGADAHTASLFPGARQLDAALDPASMADACRVDPDPLPAEAPFPRISLTLPRLLRTRSLHLVVTGKVKREILGAAFTDADARSRPIAAVLHAPGACVHIHWSP
ncbi:MAG: 6-phosphogluconolactonase [Lysobacter sp.]|nr:MAG: 6-phosphogluconolactonase [Lysobacter sp.]